jgi:hypothetical protein
MSGDDEADFRKLMGWTYCSKLEGYLKRVCDCGVMMNCVLLVRNVAGPDTHWIYGRYNPRYRERCLYQMDIEGMDLITCLHKMNLRRMRLI